jgi:predicted secreted protein
VRRFAYIAHCLLNANAKVEGGAICAGVYRPLLDQLRSRGYVIRQLPCPELAYAGARRFWAVREQYDTVVYRRHCRRLAQMAASAMEADVRGGGEIVVVGVDGSPSLGVEAAGSDATWSGRPELPANVKYQVAPGRGIFVEELLDELDRRNVSVRIVGHGHDLPDWEEGADLERIERMLERADDVDPDTDR